MIFALLACGLGALLAKPLARRLGPWAGPVLALLPTALLAYFFWKGASLDGNAAIVETVAWVPSLGIEFSLRLDGFSRLFCLLVTGIGTLVTIYAGAYFAASQPARAGSFLSLIFLFTGAMLGTVLADDLLVLFVFWEATSLLSFFLIGFDAQKDDARKAALQSLVVTAGGGLALLAAILLIGAELGTFSLSQVAARSDELLASSVAVPAMVLILVGAFTKSAQVPFHFWLPNAMAAPTPASAFLHSATMVKLGIYVLARFDAIYAGLPAFGTILVVFGSATMLVAGLRALASDGYKAVLAHSTVGSLGVLVMLIGLDGDAAVTATIGFLLAHALYKAALFFCAGIVIHATHEASLSRLGGLARALPWTAVAAGLAAVSMAGLPPTLGFISKEYLFEGQLLSSSGWIVVAIAVVANAVFVAIAGMAAFTPFHARGAKPRAEHPESAGLIAGPLVLATLGLLFGLAPALIAGSLIEPAVGALTGGAVPISFSLWHGFTPMLALSGVVVVVGLVLFLTAARVRERLTARTGIERLLGDRGYEVVFGGLLALARSTTRTMQNGDQRRYTFVTLVAVLAICLYGVWRSGVPLSIDAGSGRFDPAGVAVLVLMAVAAISAALALSLTRALIAVGVVGFGSAVLFLMNGAPDLALTQFSVEVLVVVVLVALLSSVRDRAPRTRGPRERGLDAAFAGGFGLVLFAALLATVTRPLDLRLTEFFSQTSYTQAFGRNVVNVILVDYRALDTLGEIAVVGFSAIAVWGLLRATARSRSASR